MAHNLLEEDVGGRGQRHGRARVAGTDLLYGVGGQHPQGVDGATIQISEVGEGVGGGIGHCSVLQRVIRFHQGQVEARRCAASPSSLPAESAFVCVLRAEAQRIAHQVQVPVSDDQVGPLGQGRLGAEGHSHTC